MNNFFTAPCLGLLCLVSTAATAQPAPDTASGAVTPSAGYQSAFQDYTPYSDEKIVDWKTANATTARIGGWRAYAREASAPAVAAKPVPAPPMTPMTPNAGAKP